MKRIGLFFTIMALFGTALFVAYQQGLVTQVGALGSTTLSSISGSGGSVASGFLVFLGSVFLAVFEPMVLWFEGNMFLAIIVLALLVELVSLYPAVTIQLKQKKIHLFHKKLVDRFKSGELGMSQSKRELDVLYSVNERIHRRGAGLLAFQALAFIITLVGLQLLTQGRLDPFAFSSASLPLLAAPAGMILPVLAALTYMLHSLIKIQVRQKEDYLSSGQMVVALLFAVLGSVVAFFFAQNFATLLTLYFMTQLTFATLRYLIVESKAKAWGKLAQVQLIQMLRDSKLHKNKFEYLSRKFNHLPLVRHINFHLLEEGVSMSLAFVLMLNVF